MPAIVNIHKMLRYFIVPVLKVFIMLNKIRDT